ncbi:histone deacetylase, partial [Leptolyngbya valderiana BDU 20041]
MDLPIVHHRDYVAPLPPKHRFPMAKFGGLFDRILADGIATPDQIHVPRLATFEEIEWVHQRDYTRAYCDGTLDPKVQRRIGLPWTPELVRRTRAAVGGTLLTAQLALKCGLACNTVGGTHHAFPDRGSGFCIFNDLAIAARFVQKQGLAKTVLIVDLDVHQGDGTAAIFHGDDSVFTFSMHCEANFPSRKQTSDLDVPLSEGLEDDEY